MTSGPTAARRPGERHNLSLTLLEAPLERGDGARPVAFARLHAELPALTAERLAPHERPRVLLVLSALPTTSSGKVDRADLRRRLTAALALPHHEREPVS